MERSKEVCRIAGIGRCDGQRTEYKKQNGFVRTNPDDGLAAVDHHSYNMVVAVVRTHPRLGAV